MRRTPARTGIAMTIHPPLSRPSHDGVRVAIAAPALLGEGPMWLPGEQALWYCDIPARRLHRFDPATHENRHWDFHTDVGSGAPCPDGSFVLALRDGLWHFDPRDDSRTRIAGAPYDPS